MLHGNIGADQGFGQPTGRNVVARTQMKLNRALKHVYLFLNEA